MRYKLYLDDLRNLPDLHPDWRLARNYHDAVWYVKNYGLPYHISFDHDLGISHLVKCFGALKEFTGLDFAKWFCGHVMDLGITDLDGFTYNVHSANPVGAENIRLYMENFLKDGMI